MFKGTLEVGKEYELNNGEVHKCGCGFFADHKIGGALYTPDGQYCAATADHPRSVRGPAVGTLAELDVKPGDVVSHVSYMHGMGSDVMGHLIINEALGIGESGAVLFRPHSESTFRIISRAEHTAEPEPIGDDPQARPLEYIARYVERLADAPTVFGDMTDAEKGALLLANHGGQGVQAYINGRLLDVDMYSILADDVAYRVKPKPVVETVVMSGSNHGGFIRAHRVADTHRLTFDVIDGDLTNPRFEPINEADD